MTLRSSIENEESKKKESLSLVITKQDVITKEIITKEEIKENGSGSRKSIKGRGARRVLKNKVKRELIRW